MKTLLLMTMLLIPVVLMAQTDTDKNATERYCVLKIQGKLFGSGVNIVADFGQQQSLFVQRLKDEAGKVVDLHSTADALNYMAERGWVFAQAYTLANKDVKEDVVFYVLKKKAP